MVDLELDNIHTEQCMTQEAANLQQEEPKFNNVSGFDFNIENILPFE